MNRREFLVRAGLTLSASALGGQCPQPEGLINLAAAGESENWGAVRAQFPLTSERIHMAGFLLASHPTPVREAVELHRRSLDENPVEYLYANQERLDSAVPRAAADYLGVQPSEIALTDSTTMGLGLLYGGFTLREEQEILTTTHDHYSTEMSLRLRAKRTGARFRQIALYRKPAAISREEVVETFVRAVRPQTRIIAVTWVHSSTGVKLPLRQMADALTKVNASRAEADRALFCVDGVHGFGVEDIRMEDLGCDFFIAGCHKWLFGPRGTGLVWGKRESWPLANAIIPSFHREPYRRWLQGVDLEGVPMGALLTPGGFHSFEHRWALAEAFQFHQTIGKGRIAARIHALNRQLKEGLAEMGHVTLHTPRAEDLSAGIVCFEVKGLTPEQVVARLLDEHRIIASVTPYATRYARLAPSLLTSAEEVDWTLQAIASLNKATP